MKAIETLCLSSCPGEGQTRLKLDLPFIFLTALSAFGPDRFCFDDLNPDLKIVTFVIFPRFNLPLKFFAQLYMTKC